MNRNLNVAVAILAILVTGCGNPFTKINYEIATGDHLRLTTFWPNDATNWTVVANHTTRGNMFLVILEDNAGNYAQGFSGKTLELGSRAKFVAQEFRVGAQGGPLTGVAVEPID